MAGDLMNSAEDVSSMADEADGIASQSLKKFCLLGREDASVNLMKGSQAEISEHDTVASFQRGWQQVLAGQTSPIDDLWDDIDAE